MKKKIFGITLAVCLVVLSIASSTMAYFTDTDAKTQVFTSGNVKIEFTNEIFTNSDSNAVHPGKQLGVDATVANKGTENAYVGIVINFSKVIPADDAKALFGTFGGENGIWETKYVQSADTCSIYVICPNVLEKTSEVTFFENIVIPLEWNNDQMAAFNSTTITVTAYATQVFGFNDAKTALTTAFHNEWSAVGN